MKKVFLSTSFSGKVEEQSGQIVPEFRAFIEQVLAGLRKDDMAEVFCAVEHEGWLIANDIPPEVGVKKDIEELNKAEVLVALVHDKPSAGVQFDLGYAVAKGKRVILASHQGEQLAYFNQGAVSSGFMTHLSYEDTGALISQLTLAVHAPDARPLA